VLLAQHGIARHLSIQHLAKQVLDRPDRPICFVTGVPSAFVDASTPTSKYVSASSAASSEHRSARSRSA
jgi:hypothetical protein